MKLKIANVLLAFFYLCSKNYLCETRCSELQSKSEENQKADVNLDSNFKIYKENDNSYSNRFALDSNDKEKFEYKLDDNVNNARKFDFDVDHNRTKISASIGGAFALGLPDFTNMPLKPTVTVTDTIYHSSSLYGSDNIDASGYVSSSTGTSLLDIFGSTSNSIVDSSSGMPLKPTVTTIDHSSSLYGSDNIDASGYISSSTDTSLLDTFGSTSNSIVDSSSDLTKYKTKTDIINIFNIIDTTSTGIQTFSQEISLDPSESISAESSSLSEFLSTSLDELNSISSTSTTISMAELSSTISGNIDASASMSDSDSISISSTVTSVRPSSITYSISESINSDISNTESTNENTAELSSTLMSESTTASESLDISGSLNTLTTSLDGSISISSLTTTVSTPELSSTTSESVDASSSESASDQFSISSSSTSINSLFSISNSDDSEMDGTESTNINTSELSSISISESTTASDISEYLSTSTSNLDGSISISSMTSISTPELSSTNSGDIDASGSVSASESISISSTLQILNASTEANSINPTISSIYGGFDSTIEFVTDSSGSIVTDPNGNIVTAEVDSDGTYIVTDNVFNAMLDDIYNKTLDFTFTPRMNVTNKKKCGFISNAPMLQQAPSNIQTVAKGLVWGAQTKSLYYADKNGYNVQKYDPATGQFIVVILNETNLNTIFQTTIPNQYVIGLKTSIIGVSIAFSSNSLIVKASNVFAQFQGSSEISTGKLDDQSRYWTAARYEINNVTYEKLYMINLGKAKLMKTFKGRIGDFVWCKNKKKFYISAIKNRTVLSYDYDSKSGNITNERIFFDIRNYRNLTGIPTGIAIDKENHIWLTLFGGGAVIHVNLKNAQIMHVIALPNKNPLSIAFGGNGLSRIFVSTEFIEYPARKNASIYVISNVGVSGASVKYSVNTKKVFGISKIKVTVSNTSLTASETDSALIHYTTDPTKELSIINKKAGGSCPFLSKEPFIQQVFIPIQTIGSDLSYDSKKVSMYMVDVFKPAVIKYNIITGLTITLNFELTTSIGTIVPTTKTKKDDIYVVALDHKIIEFKNKFRANAAVTATPKALATLKTSDPNVIFGIGKVDSSGRLWQCTRPVIMGTNSESNLYVLQKIVLTQKQINVTVCGGMTWSTNNKIFYLADIGAAVIYKFKYTKATATLSKQTVFFNLTRETDLSGTISDVTVDSDNNVWATVLGGGAVIRINSKTMKLTQLVALPTKTPMSLSWGKIDTLFVSSERVANNERTNAPFVYAISNLDAKGPSRTNNKFIL